MEMNLGQHGATHQSWHGDAIRVIVRELQEDHPRADEKALVKLLTEKLLEDPTAAKAAAIYIVRNTLDAQRGYQERAKRNRINREQRAMREAEINKAVKTQVQTILTLNYPMPNGKRLRHCTGTYVAKLGGAFRRVGKKAGTKLIGEVFDENSLRECMGVDVEQ